MCFHTHALQLPLAPTHHWWQSLQAELRANIPYLSGVSVAHHRWKKGLRHRESHDLFMPMGITYEEGNIEYSTKAITGLWSCDSTLYSLYNHCGLEIKKLWQLKVGVGSAASILMSNDSLVSVMLQRFLFSGMLQWFCFSGMLQRFLFSGMLQWFCFSGMLQRFLFSGMLQ